MEQFDYKGFARDFTIADIFGEDAVRDTYNRAFREWKDNVDYFASLVMTLNHKIWAWHGKDDSLARVYDELWREADSYGCDHFKGDDLSYYLNFLD